MRFLERLQPLALLVLRVVLGAIMIAYGAQKAFGGMQAFTRIVAGFSFPWWTAYVAVAIELGGGTLVLFLLLSHFRDGRGVFFSLFPVLAGVAAMLGLMAATGMGINFMNAMVLVTILGMGSDYGLYIAHRVNPGHNDLQQKNAFIQAGRSVFLSALTTIIGFGSLAFTDYGAFSSIGWATNFGVGATICFTLLVLPAFCCRERGAA